MLLVTRRSDLYQFRKSRNNFELRWKIEIRRLGILELYIFLLITRLIIIITRRLYYVPLFDSDFLNEPAIPPVVHLTRY